MAVLYFSFFAKLVDSPNRVSKKNAGCDSNISFDRNDESDLYLLFSFFVKTLERLRVKANKVYCQEDGEV